MIPEIGDEEFDRLLVDRLGLVIQHFNGVGVPCHNCKRNCNPRYGMPFSASLLCVSCIKKLQSQFAAVLVLSSEFKS